VPATESAAGAIASMQIFVASIRKRLAEVNAENEARRMGSIVRRRSPVAGSIASQGAPARYTSPATSIPFEIPPPGAFAVKPQSRVQTATNLFAARASLVELECRRAAVAEADLASASELAATILRDATSYSDATKNTLGATANDSVP
jgi:hypothetical protein